MLPLKDVNLSMLQIKIKKSLQGDTQLPWRLSIEILIIIPVLLPPESYFCQDNKVGYQLMIRSHI